jgi:hypothetical protein
MNTKWEEITKTTSRMPVFGGWIILHSKSQCSSSPMGGVASALSESMVFVPDHNHEWEIEKCEK